MAKRKKVRLICHEPIAILPTYEQGWSDVYVEYADRRPGRKTIRWGPTLLSLMELKSDLRTARELQKKHPDLDWSEDIRDAEAAIEALKTQQFFIQEMNDPGIPNVYTASKWINRAEAERMILFFLTTKGIRNPKLSWDNPGGFFVIPTTFARDDDAE